MLSSCTFPTAQPSFFPPPVLHKSLHTPSGPCENPPEVLPSASRHGLKVTETKFNSQKKTFFFSFLTIPLQGIPSQSVKGETGNSDEKRSPLFSLELVMWNPKRSCTVSPREKAGHEAHFTYINRVIKKKSFKEIKAKQCRSWIFISWTLDRQLTFHPMLVSKASPSWMISILTPLFCLLLSPFSASNTYRMAEGERNHDSICDRNQFGQVELSGGQIMNLFAKWINRLARGRHAPPPVLFRPQLRTLPVENNKLQKKPKPSKKGILATYER